LGIEEENADGYAELGRVLTYQGQWDKANSELEKALQLEKTIQYQGIIWSYRALRFLLMGRENQSKVEEPALSLSKGQRSQVENRQSQIVNLKSSIESARRALELADETARTSTPNELNYVEAHWMLGAAYRASGDLEKAEFHLNESINRCRKINLVMDEANILLDVARLRYAEGNFNAAQEKASEALGIAERSGYVLQGADINLFLAELAMKGLGNQGLGNQGSGNREQARKYAEEALRLATCEGGEYKYKAAYEEAEKMLARLIGL
jgi:tetratricopeptide (TPR) repeat protein